MNSGQSLIAEAITDYLGGRCPEYAEGCFCCEAWAEFDRLTTNSLSQVSSSQPAEPAGEVFLLQTSPATPLNPRPRISRGSSLPDAQIASAGDTAASLSYSDGDA